MIYEAIKGKLLGLLKAPRHAPDPPAGSADSIQVFSAAPNFVKLRFCKLGLGFVGGLAIELGWVAVELIQARTSGSGLDTGELLFAGGLIAFTAIMIPIQYFLIRLDYDMRYYVLTDRSLRIREGAMIIHESTITYANIQNLTISQGPLERLLGLSNVVVQTAGGGGQADGGSDTQGLGMHRNVFRGVANPHVIRDQIRSLLKAYRDAGLGDVEDRQVARAAGLPSAATDVLRDIRDDLVSWRESLAETS